MGPHVWAMWDGKRGVHAGKQAGVVELPEELRRARPEFCAAIEGVLEPDAAEMVANFTAAVCRWVAAGLPVVSGEAYKARREACNACHWWNGGAMLGLGKCTHAGCGCTRFKPWLATERCPAGLWPQGSSGS